MIRFALGLLVPLMAVSISPPLFSSSAVAQEAPAPAPTPLPSPRECERKPPEIS